MKRRAQSSQQQPSELQDGGYHQSSTSPAPFQTLHRQRLLAELQRVAWKQLYGEDWLVNKIADGKRVKRTKRGSCLLQGHGCAEQCGQKHSTILKFQTMLHDREVAEATFHDQIPSGSIPGCFHFAEHSTW